MPVETPPTTQPTQGQVNSDLVADLNALYGTSLQGDEYEKVLTGQTQSMSSAVPAMVGPEPGNDTLSVSDEMVQDLFEIYEPEHMYNPTVGQAKDLAALKNMREEELPLLSQTTGAAHALGRAGLGAVSAVVGAPRVIAEFLPGVVPESTDLMLKKTSDRFVAWSNNVMSRGALAPDPRSHISASGMNYFTEAVSTPQWWTNVFPEFTAQTASIMVPGMVASKGAKALGFSQKVAARFGVSVSTAAAYAQESTTTYYDLVEQLELAGVPHEEAKEVASKGAVAYGIVSALMEHKLLNFTGRNPFRSRIMQMIRGATSETVTEMSQMLAQASAYELISQGVEVELRPVLTGENITNTFMGAMSSGGVMHSRASAAFSQYQDIVNVISERTGVPKTEVKKMLGDTIQESILAQEERAKAIQSGEPDPNPVTEQVQEANREVADEDVLPAVEGQEQATPTSEELTQYETRQQERQELLGDKPTKTEAKRGQIQDQEALVIRAAQLQLDRLINTGRKDIDDKLRNNIADNLPPDLSRRQREDFIARAQKADTPQKLRSLIVQAQEASKKGRQEKAQQRLSKLIREVKPNELTPEQRKAVVAKINNLDPKAMSKDEKAILESFREFMERDPREERAVPGKREREVDRLDKKNVSELKEEQADEISDLIESATSESAEDFKRREASRDQSVKGVSEDMSEEMDETARRAKKFDSKSDRANDTHIGPMKKLLKSMFGLEYANTLESVLEIISGSDQSTTMKVLFNQVYAATNKMRQRYRRLVDDRNALIEAMGEQNDILSWVRPGADGDLTKLLNSLGIRIGQNRAVPETIVLTTPSGEPEGSRTIELYKAERSLLYAMLRDRQTYDLIVFEKVPIMTAGMKDGKGMVLTPSDISAIEESMSVEEKQMANHFVAQVNGKEQDAWRDVTMRLFGREFVRNEGGVAIPRQRARMHEDRKLEPLQFMQRTVENAGLAKKREDSDRTNAIKITDIFSAYERWATQHSAVVELSDNMNYALSVLNSEDVTRSLNKSYGSEIKDRIMASYEAVMAEVVGSTIPLKGYDRAIIGIANNITKARLFFRPKVATYQVASFSTLSTQIPWRHITSSLDAIPRRTEVLEEMYKWMPMMRDRIEDGSIRIVDYAMREDSRTLEEFRQKTIETYGAMGIKEMDSVVMRVGWEASKKMAADEGHSGDALYARAAQLMEKATRQTQPTFDPLTISGLSLESRRSGAARIINFFRGQRQKNVDMTIMNIVRLKRGQITKAEFAYNMSMINIAQPGLIAMVKAGWRVLPLMAAGAAGAREDEVEWEEEIRTSARDFLGASMGNFVFGSTLADAAGYRFIGGRQPRFQYSPLVSTLSNAVTASNQVIAAESPSDLIKPIMKMASTTGDLSGYQVSVFEDIIKFFGRVTTDEDKPKRSQSRGTRGRRVKRQ